VEYLHFAVLALPAHASYEFSTTDCETGMVILSGAGDIVVDTVPFVHLGGRMTVFEGRATAVYAPPRSQVTVRASASGIEVALCRCQAESTYPACVVRPGDVHVREVGGPGFRRYVHDILGPQVPASRLIVGETYTIHGNWSSFPPHKHDVEALPDEVRQEELYLYRIRPEHGFGLQYLYTASGSPHRALDQAVVVYHNDIVVIPNGYHPVAAPPGYDVYYLWFLAGPARLMRPRDDPAHAWVKTDPLEPRAYP
jgi:5-deoxy-glucuronate isomerase